MKTFHCTHCQNLVFFENVTCLACQHRLAYLPDENLMAALQQQADGTWTIADRGATQRRYRLCDNYLRAAVCNWAVPAEDPLTLCQSCRLTRVIPNLDSTENRTAWFLLEQAKRRMLYTVLALRLPLKRKMRDSDAGVAFEFLQETCSGDAARVLTGHDNGLITVNIAEADDVQRERQRKLQGEPYRTLLGHFRHEIGHYYWNRLIANSSRLKRFRELFGDERADYQAALRIHYENGPPANWQERYISSYATTHPWEDWAESWAHYMHMIDVLELAGSAGVNLQPQRLGAPSLAPPSAAALRDFDTLVRAWFPLTYLFNSLNRGMGLPDGYPFVLSAPVIEKLRFVHQTVQER
jgi:hypothetical protein